MFIIIWGCLACPTHVILAPRVKSGFELRSWSPANRANSGEFRDPTLVRRLNQKNAPFSQMPNEFRLVFQEFVPRIGIRITINNVLCIIHTALSGLLAWAIAGASFHEPWTALDVPSSRVSVNKFQERLKNSWTFVILKALIFLTSRRSRNQRTMGN